GFAHAQGEATAEQAAQSPAPSDAALEDPLRARTRAMDTVPELPVPDTMQTQIEADAAAETGLAPAPGPAAPAAPGPAEALSPAEQAMRALQQMTGNAPAGGDSRPVVPLATNQDSPEAQ